MQHLEEVARSDMNPTFDVLLKNILYGRYQDQDQSVSGVLAHKNNVYKRAPASTAKAFIEQIEMVRQFMHPALSEFVSMFEYLVEVTHQMVEEAWRRGYFSEQMESQRISFQLKEAADEDINYVRRMYRRDLDTAILPEQRYNKYAGFQAADVLRKYLQSYDVKDEHVASLMEPEKCMDRLIHIMCEIESKRQQEGGIVWANDRVYANYELFVHDMTGPRQAEANVVIDNDSLSVINKLLVLNPSINMRGQRRTNGVLDPYVEVEEFLSTFQTTKDAFIHVCLAYNLFGLTEVWFRSFVLWRWDQLDWDALDDHGHLNVLLDEHYPNVSRLTMSNFHSLAYDLRQVFKQAVKIEPEDPYGGYATMNIMGGDYDEQGQQWAAQGEPHETMGRLGGFSSSDEGETRGYEGEPGAKKDDKTMMYALLAAGGGALLYFNS